MFYVTKELAIMALVLLLGIVIGMIMRGGNGRLRQQLADERAAHIATRKERDARINEIERTRVVPPPRV